MRMYLLDYTPEQIRNYERGYRVGHERGYVGTVVAPDHGEGNEFVQGYRDGWRAGRAANAGQSVEVRA